ncbi:MAG: DUF3179 domain-containing protein [Chitinophagaceae bacterium]|nr:DUF3179 domain-containing protein [Chitinophagaceae bacterium]
MKTFLLITGFVLLFAVEILRVYFIMPFPGSQQTNTIDTAYWIARNIWWLRIVAVLLLAYPAWSLLRRPGLKWKKAMFLFFLVLYGAVCFMVNFKMEADKMFYQPKIKQFASGDANAVPADKLVIGVALNGEAKAYPIQFIGYHHQVADTVGGQPVIITYCTVCRTGRVYSPTVNGKPETFRLVGMDHFNAMFEDAGTKSWWRQVTGEAIAGPLKGAVLREIPSQQMSLTAWQRANPGTLVMQADSNFKETYEKMANYEKGRSKSDLTRRDSLSWHDKSWVVGISYYPFAKAYDWNRLVKERLIQDSFPGLPVLLVLEKDTVSFHAWSRVLDGNALQFTKTADPELIRDGNTGSDWNMDGFCVSGVLKGKKLSLVKAYQEYWHSWREFHPGTLR